MTDRLTIDKTESTPQVDMDPDEGRISFLGTSWPEDALSFYAPILRWVSDYFGCPKPETTLEFRFSYFNTASAKQIAKLFSIIKACKDKTCLNIMWFYEEGDSEMLKSGSRFSSLLGIPFDFVETEEQPDQDDEDEPEGTYHVVD